jgi:hypothetical protein
MLCEGRVTARSRYQTNAVQVHDFVKTVWSQAYEYCRVLPWWGSSDRLCSTPRPATTQPRV